MTDDSTNPTDGVPLDDLPLENTRRTLLRALGGATVVGAMSGVAAGGDDDDDHHDDHGEPVSFWLLDLLELHGLSIRDDRLHLDELCLEGPVDDEPHEVELFSVTDLEATVEDAHLTDLGHGSLELHETVESDVEAMIRGNDERVDDVRDLLVSILNANEDEIHDAVEPALEDGQAALLDLGPSLGDQFESGFEAILAELEAELDEAGGVEELSDRCIAEIDERGVLALVETEFGFTCLLLFLFSLLTVLSELETDPLDLPV